MKRGWLASLLAAAVVLPLSARGADGTKAPDTTPPKAASNATETAKPIKGRLPPYFAKLPVTAEQKVKIYEIEATFSPKIKELREKLEALQADESQQIKALLTPEQLEKLKTLMAEARGKRRGKPATDATPKAAPTDKPAPTSSSTTTPTPAPK